MSPQLAKLLAGAVLILSLVGWALFERSEKLSSQKEVAVLKGDLELSNERIRENGRAITALGTATTAAQARAATLEGIRRRENAPLVAQIQRFETRLKDLASTGKTACVDAFKEWRNGS